MALLCKCVYYLQCKIISQLITERRNVACMLTHLYSHRLSLSGRMFGLYRCWQQWPRGPAKPLNF